MRIITLIIACLSMALGAAVVTNANAGSKDYEIQKSDKEWRSVLDKQAYRVLRQQGTERAYTSPLLKESRHGLYRCAACGQEVFASDHKFDSGTGWPSFYQPAAGNMVESKTDFKIGYPRTEVHCARCGGHLGHVFKDGPEPTGLRYCINGAALNFTPIP